MERIKTRDAASMAKMSYSTFLITPFYQNQKTKKGFKSGSVFKDDFELYLKELEERKRIPKPVWKSDAV